MRIYLKNIGMIKEADVKIDGLTLIAGENDTGKSTVGKVIFSIVKGIQKYEENLEDKFKKELFIYLDDFYKKYNKFFNDKLGLRFFPLVFADYIMKNKDSLERVFKYYKKFLSNLKIDELNSDFQKLQDKVEEILTQNDEKLLKEEALRRAFFSEFRNQLRLNRAKEGLIKVLEQKNSISIEILEQIKLIDDFEIELEDVTLIETPMILNFSDMIQSARSHFEEEELNKTLIRLEADIIYHSKDLINKLVNSAKFGNEEIDNNLNKILKFDFEYDNLTREFLYVKGKEKFHSINVADGIKAFGIIKLLLKGNYIRENTLLIIDEPEVHLHPKWQIEYAKLIVELVKKGIKVLITSHSPFFIEAIDKLSFDIEKNYYFAENGIIKEDNDLALMYEKLNIVIDKLEDLEVEEMAFKVKN